MSTNVGASDLAARLRLHRSRDGWRGQCPACGYPESFVLSAGNAGRCVGWCASCANKAAIAELLRELQGGNDTEAWRPEYAATKAARAAKRFESAMRIWDQRAGPLPGTPAAHYLAVRGLPHLVGSHALRFSPECPHPDGRKYPALVALIQDVTGGPAGIHRTFLKRDGSAKADIEPQRASLGSIWGSAVRLSPVADQICIGEGIETAGSAGLLLKLPAWAAVACGNLERALNLPSQVRSVVIAADPDEPGRNAAAGAWHRWNDEGRRVRISTPKPGRGDFNNVLMRRMALGET